MYNNPVYAKICRKNKFESRLTIKITGNYICIKSTKRLLYNFYFKIIKYIYPIHFLL